MANSSSPSRPDVHVDADGVRTVRARAPRRLRVIAGIAIGLPVLVALIAIVALRAAPIGTAAVAPPPARVAADDPAAAPPDEEVAAPLAASAAPVPAVAPVLNGVAAAPRQAVAHEDVVPRRSTAARAAPSPNPEDDERPNIDARDAIPALIAEGEQGGITVFPLPGTKPIKEGLIVPDGVQLPEGYVRHYQATDDGQMLPPILMFHPDYEFTNDRGERIAVPENHVVPPELAPRGLENAEKLQAPPPRNTTRLP